jgi:tRNA(fMet)-specific endonuclease VapC
MTFLLDTNAFIDALNAKSSRVVQRLAQTPNSNVFVSAVVEAELLYGAAKSRDPFRAAAITSAFLAAFPRLSFDSKAAAQYGAIRATLEAAGIPIGPNDTMIAATALAYNLTIVTANVREFSRVAGLTVEDWTKP